MATMTKKRFDAPDDTRAPDKTKVEVVDLGGAKAARLTAEPGWRWSECIKPVVGGDSCQARHVGFVTAGRIHLVHDDGSELDLGPGDAYVIEPGHDAWVVGDEPLVAFEFESATADSYARRPADGGGGRRAEHPNAALVRRGFDAFNRGDVDVLRELFASDAVQVEGGANLLTGEHKGADAILGMYARLGEHTGGTFRAELEQVFANDSMAVALYRGTAQREGKSLDQRYALLFEIMDGRFVRLTDLPGDPEAADAFLA